MKKLVICLITICAHSQYFGQNTATTNVFSSAPNIAATLRNNNVFDPNKLNNTIKGTPYNNNDYQSGTVVNINAPISFRYNAYRDAIEFREGEKVLDLPKETTYSPLIFGNKKLVLLKDKSGLAYYTELYSGNNYSLLKRDKINLIEAKESNGYNDVDRDAKFSSLKTEYFYKTKDNQIIDFPKNKKTLLNTFKPSSDASAFLNKNSNFIKDENKLIELTKLLDKN